MKPLSILVFSVFAYLGLLGRLQWATLHTVFLEGNFEKMCGIHWENMCSLYFCTDSSSLVNVSPWNT